MTTTPVRSAEHTSELRAPAERAYQLIADVTRWPVLFAPCLAAAVLEKDSRGERIRLWALAGETVRSWISARELDPDALAVTFRQEQPAPPLASMTGYWRFEPAPARVVLGHEWTSRTGSPEEEHLITTVLNRNSRAETDAVKSWAERAESPEELIFSFVDHVAIRGDIGAVYEFLHRADLWPQRLPHVDSLDMRTEDDTVAGAQVQTMGMRTRTAGGSTHATRSIRLCFQDNRIVYKQTTVPKGLLGHSGEWLLTPSREGTEVTARHQVALDPDALTEVFGAGTSLAEARMVVRDRLGGNSLRTLAAARQHVERS